MDIILLYDDILLIEFKLLTRIKYYRLITMTIYYTTKGIVYLV